MALFCNAPLFDSHQFGALVFALGDELPTKTTDRDLDGDTYFCIWDEEVIGGITVNDDIDENELEVMSDDLEQTTCLIKHNDKCCDTEVMKKV